MTSQDFFRELSEFFDNIQVFWDYFNIYKVSDFSKYSSLVCSSLFIWKLVKTSEPSTSSNIFVNKKTPKFKQQTLWPYFSNISKTFEIIILLPRVYQKLPKFFSPHSLLCISSKICAILIRNAEVTMWSEAS